MTVFRAFAIIIPTAILFGAAGAGVGYFLGVAAPDYYRNVFRSAAKPDFDPVAVGLGMGLTQGLIAGLAVGSVVVLAVSWHRSGAATGADQNRD